MPTPNGDLVDRIQDEWTQVYPDLDFDVVGILARIHRIAAITTHRLDRKLEAHGITRSEFDVLGALVRAGRPVRAGEIVSTTMLSGASITKLTERLARAGLIERRKSARDGRVILLEVTEAGRTLVDTELPRRLADEQQAMAALDPAEREALSGLLRTLAGEVERLG